MYLYFERKIKTVNYSYIVRSVLYPLDLHFFNLVFMILAFDNYVIYGR